ncbi:MAG: discoidin domain-containing protein, partial [Deltaproteobacteria bacterium]|nr:discoidin domain-containing protein [Deltaproteobacteria bacterium]
KYAPAANGHIVYFSESFSDVNDGIGGITQSVTSYDPGRLDLETTYCWRIDEVNGAPDFTVHQGGIWSFTTEPVGYPIANVTATASSSDTTQGSANATVDGSGLTDDLHSTDIQTMWLSNAAGPQPTWIQFEFDCVYMLHEMWVWNSNTELETAIGYGFKDVTIEYSVDGTDYTTLGATHEFAPATGTGDYAHNTTIDFGGSQAKYVRLTPNSNWKSFVVQFGLSEVRFFHIPLRARGPDPASGATDVDVDVTLDFRAGRQAAEHNVYVSTDEQAVIDGAAPVTVVTETNHSLSSLDLDTTYYWRVDEVNDAEIPTTWQGDVWNFSTREYFVVDDFESYNDIEAGQEGSNPVYEVWLDGVGTTTNGSTMGYNVPFQPTMETGIVHGGGQSVPLQYDNTTAALSEVTRTLASQDWTVNGIKTLSLWFRGDPANVPGQLYVKVNNAKAPFDGSAAAISTPFWTQWNVDLGAAGTDLSSVNTLTIGVEGGSGIIYVDDIRLYAKAAEFIIPPSIVAVEDAWVREANPDTNFGAPGAADSDRLRWNSEAGQALAQGVRNRSFIKFEVPANAPENVQLVVNRTNGGVAMEIRLVVTNAWDESTITWNNQPAFGNVVVASGDPGGGINRFDVSDHITGPSTYSFVVVGVADPGENAGTFESKDAGGNNPPILEFK